MNNNLGTIRFLAAFGVLFGHTYNLAIGKHGPLDPVSALIHKVSPFYVGLPGVAVAAFFVISGYLVTKSMVERDNLWEYTEARVLRIYPALIVAVIFCIFVGALVTTLPLQQYFTHKGVWNFFVHNSSLFGLHYRLPGVFMSNPWQGGVNGSLWTLPIELAMYILVALAYLLGFLRNRVSFNMIALALVLVFIAAPENSPLLAKPNHYYLCMSFILGAFFYLNREVIPLRLGLFILSLLPLFLSFGSKYYVIFSALSFSYGLLLLGFSQKIKLPDLSKNGDLSYGLYLYAFPLQQLAIYQFGGDSIAVIMILSFFGALFMAKLSWVFIEKPALSLKGSLSTKTRNLIVGQ